MVAAKQNLEGANENLDEARKEQKKAGNKYTCVIITIILGLLIGAGVLIIILTQWYVIILNVFSTKSIYIMQIIEKEQKKYLANCW